MTFRFIRSSLLMALLSWSTSIAYASPTDEVVAIFENLNTIQGQFTQTLYSQKNKPLSQSSGTFVIERPNKFVWDVTSPSAQQSVSNGKEIWIYQPDLEQATVSPISKQIGATPLAILSGSTIALKQAYTIAKESSAQPEQRIYLFHSKEANSPFNMVRLYFKANTLLSMELFDNLGQKTQITFSHIETNQKVNQAIFDFHPPKGTDVVQ
jgi:outer membrane lipoprotein carrier protein